MLKKEEVKKMCLIIVLPEVSLVGIKSLSATHFPNMYTSGIVVGADRISMRL